MPWDVVQVVGEITSYITAAAGAYGVAVPARTQDDRERDRALGRLLAQRIFGSRADGEELPEAFADVVEEPDDPDTTAVLRKAIRDALGLRGPGQQ